MIDVRRDDEEIVIRFPKDLLSDVYLEKFLQLLRLEQVALKNKMTEEQAWEISEEMKEDWWRENKERFLQGVK